MACRELPGKAVLLPLNVGSVPIDATYPQRAGLACRELPGNAVLPPLNVGPGCSNSIFP